MNQLQALESGWRNAFFRQIENWDRAADSVNPLLFVALLGAALCLSRASHANAWRFLSRSILAILLSFVAVKLLQRLDWFEAGRNGAVKIEGNFPSTHMSVAVSLATSLFFAARKWLMIVPLLVFYAWLMTALRYHWWIDILGGALVAFFLTAIVHLIANKQNSRTPEARMLNMTSSTRSSRRSPKSSASTPRKTRTKTRR